jgi:DHA2 family methylenomycin A resistance protein-like MFS transporter
VLGVAVLGAIVRTRQSGGASFETGLNSAFLAAGTVTLATAVITGLWLARSKPTAPQHSTDPDAATTSHEAPANSR